MMQTTDAVTEKTEIDARPGYLQRAPVRTLLEDIRVAAYDAALIDMKRSGSQDPEDLKVLVLSNFHERVNVVLDELRRQG